MQIARGGFGTGGPVAANLAIKDGTAAGPPVSHLHIHIVPRDDRDSLGDDRVFELLDSWSPQHGVVNKPPQMEWPDDATRSERTREIMAAEAQAYRDAFIQNSDHTCSALPTGITFSKFSIEDSQIFYVSQTGLTVAIVNLKPLQPGHVLVIPARVVPLMNDLKPEEVTDLWLTVRHVQAMVQAFYKASASDLGVQDGRDAGQSVPHVHVHVIPRL